MLHGSEARTPARHRATYPFSPFDDLLSAAVEWAKREEQSAKIHAVLDRLPVRRFVTTPDMLDFFVDDATWLPLAIGAGAFRAGRPLFSRERPVFLHAPSGPVKVPGVRRRRPRAAPRRGSARVPPALGRGPGSPAHLRDADVVIDHFMLGGSGVLAVQAMAAGRLVLGHVAEHVRARYAEPLPILEADPTTLREVVLGIIADREAAAAGVGRTGLRLPLGGGPARVRRRLSARAPDGVGSAARQPVAQHLGDALGRVAVAVGRRLPRGRHLAHRDVPHALVVGPSTFQPSSRVSTHSVSCAAWCRAPRAGTPLAARRSR